MTHRLEAPHGKEVGHHGAEARCEAGLRDEAELQLSQADDVIATLPVPAGDVEQVGLKPTTTGPVTRLLYHY